MTPDDKGSGAGQSDAKNLADTGTAGVAGAKAGDPADTAKAAPVVDASKANDDAAAKAATSLEADAAAARTRAAAADADRATQEKAAQDAASTAGNRPTAAPAPSPFLNQGWAGSHGGDDARVNTDPAMNLATPEGRIAQHDQVDRENEERNARNAEVFNRRMDEELKAREAANDRPEAHQPPTGKQRDENTPELLPDGTAVWRK